ncbi:hypothetical protein [Chryseobacterium aquaticum]|uniref:Uncharacterized protein n=1 Tax=Chryseobacterium aquaticum subsp. greenlandense TaxID=345663 RepID=A0A101CKG5_9FLAO|nr:hypothetical protein [Chryseobacterium aquaticum]KUJ57625.1 hypothetical protein AR686_02360 [Chryseobacterium aquaticum subsp. greenlandense]
MKSKAAFILLFAISIFYTQEKQDRKCKDFLQKEKLEFEKFKSTQSKSKYTALRNKIFSDVKKNKEVLTDNIHLCVVSNTFVNDYYPSGSENDCRYSSTLYLDKISYLDSLFWTRETFTYVEKNFRKNIFPVINHNGSVLITKENFHVFFSDGDYSFIKNFSTAYFPEKKENVFYLPNRNAKLTSGFTSILVIFKDYEFINKVEVTINNIKGLKPNVRKKTYKYIGNQWKLIETTKQN